RGDPGVVRVDPDFGRGLVLEPDVDVGRRLVADEDRREPDLPQLPNLVSNLAPNALGQRFAVDQTSCHYGLGSSTSLTSRPSDSASLTPSWRSSSSRCTSRAYLSRPMTARALGRQSACLIKIGRRR